MNKKLLYSVIITCILQATPCFTRTTEQDAQLAETAAISRTCTDLIGYSKYWENRWPYYDILQPNLKESRAQTCAKDIENAFNLPGNNLIATGQKNIENGKKKITDGEKLVESASFQKKEGQEFIRRGSVLMNNGEATYNKGKFDEGTLLTTQGQASTDKGNTLIEESEKELKQGQELIAAGRKTVAEGTEQLSQAEISLKEAKPKIDTFIKRSRLIFE
jgi:uncharacterized phage infection (PIP) family protein YhgE